MMRRPNHPITRRAGFTMLEVLVVIGIILVLMGLVLAITTNVIEKSERTRTENTLTILDMCMSEWEHVAERKLTYGIADQPTAGSVYELDEAAAPSASTLAAFSIIMKPASVKELLAQVPPDRAKQETGPPVSVRVLDAWDNQILAIFPGRKWVSGDAGSRDVDGSIRTAHENIYGVAVSGKVYFVSAGPDGKFGSLDPGATAQELSEASDNIASYEVIKP